MASQSQVTKMFSKSLSQTDIKKRLSIPATCLSYLPSFDNGNHAVEFDVVFGTRTWPLVCTVRKTGHYKKPVFSGGLWREFFTRNDLNVGDRITMYKVQDEDGTSSHFMFEVEKKLAAAPSHEVLHETSNLMMLANVATDTSVQERLNLDLVLRQPTPYEGEEVMLDLNRTPSHA